MDEISIGQLSYIPAESSQQHGLGDLDTAGIRLLGQFPRLGELTDVKHAILNLQKAAELTDDGHQSKPGRLLNLSVSQEPRFGCLGELADLNDATFNEQMVVKLSDDGHPDKPMYLANLGINQEARFGWLGELADLENAISNKQKAAELTDDGDSDKPMLLSNLGNSQGTRFRRIGELADLENAISNKQKAVKLTDDGHPDKPIYLSNLGNSQTTQTHFRHLGELSDLENAIFNKQKAVELMDDGNPDKPMYLSHLDSSQQTRFGCLGELADLENAISNRQRAVELTDDRHPSKPGYLSNLGIIQHMRFGRLSKLVDLENAISNQQKAVELMDDGHPDKPMYLSHLGSSQQTRFGRLGGLADLENAISNQQRAVELTDDRHPAKSGYLSNLGIGQHTRFGRLGELADLENAISNQQKAVELTDDEHPDKPMSLSNLGNSQKTRFRRLGDLADIKNAISNQQKAAVELTDEGHPSKPRYLSNLGISQHTRFGRLGELADIKSAILNIAVAVDLTDVRDPHRSGYLLNLGLCQESIFAFLEAESHLAAAISAFKEAAHLNTAYPSTALLAARKWADISRHGGYLSSALNGYRIALEILLRVAWLGLDPLSHRNHLLRERSENLGCLAATCAIQLGQLDEAVELLDLGRSVYWQQVSSLRSDLETLKEEDKDLVNKLESVGRKLDAQKSHDSTLIGEDQSVGINKKEVVGRRRRLLVSEWENLVEKVRQITGFKYFLRPTPFAQLRKAASVGQVIIINASHGGVDALIFGATGPIEHIPIPDIDLESLSKLSRNITTERPVNTSVAQQRNYVTRFLKPALRTIWDSIIIKIFNGIHISLADITVPPTRRIWWYPTGPLTFIPIHAAGPGRNSMGVSQLVISSYVTTLGSLLQSKGLVMKKHLKFLGISQLETPGESPLFQTAKEVDEVADVLRSSGWSEGDILSLQGSDATVSRVSSALDCCSWVHFACHGSQDHILGMKSALSLYDGHLELSAIASKRLSAGQFAFLSACHAASGVKDLPGEAMHLAAGFQFAGFPSVIATMWSIRDGDAPKVVHHTYRYLCRNGLQGLDPSEAATALNRAILHLRDDPNVTVDMWAPFVHFGI
ncbi:hypothetical protein PILCRDRAFT_77729 [Piloderma croceum F 1598]|uniref:CHAT domain-containing protein n=1 Tax=Piloderma croceum (strain F 1598) TaxID=765440 RepID=A0A0C3F941_PILCF|nr:hypothetical protein PILCRDRAFT_77729 [Piloderma croceum F 1598]